MSRVICLLLTCVYVLAVCLAAAPQAQATFITANGATVFYDGFENSTVPNLGVNDPVYGTWSSGGGSGTFRTCTGATAGGPSAAYTDNNYLAIYNNGTNPGLLNANFAGGAVQASTTSLHADFEIFSTQAYDNDFIFKFQDASGNDLGLIRTGSRPLGAGEHVYYLNSAATAYVDTGMSLTSGAWTKLALDWNHTTSQLSISVNNNPVVCTSIYGTATSIDHLAITTASSSASSLAYFDATSTSTPEPGTLVLLATGMIGLLAYAWRKRK